MSSKKQQLIDEMRTLADIRNMDSTNPVIIQIEQPLTATKFTLVASSVEPSHLAVPVNTSWVVINAASAYNGKCLRMVSIDTPNGSSAPGVIQDGGFTQSWVENLTYEDIFAAPQVYNSAGGAKGDKGDKGDKGPNGPAPTIDYSYITAQVLAALATKTLTGVTIVGATALNEATSTTYTATATFSDGTSQTNFTPVTWTADAAIGTIDSNGVLTAPTVNANTTGLVHASITSGGVTVSNTLSVTVDNVKTLTSLAIVGATSLNEATTTTFSATATFSDGSTQANFTPVTWTADVAIGTISNIGVLTAPTVSANVVGNVSVSGTYQGATVSSTPLAVTVINLPEPVYPYYGLGLVTATKNEALVLGLSGRGNVADLTYQFTLNSDATHTMFYAYPQSYGLAKFEDQAALGFFGGWDAATGDPTAGATGPLSLNVTVNGVATPFYLYQTDFPGLGSVTWKVTHA